MDVIKFTFRKEWKVLAEALGGSNPYQSEEFSAAADLVTYLSDKPASLVFASLAEKEDLIQIASLVKMAKRGAKDTILKIVIVNFSGNKQYEKAIQKLGILDVVDPSTNTKALRFKIDFYMKSLNGQIKNNSKTAMNVKSLDQSKTQGGPDQKKTDVANWLPPMECEDDIWLIKKETDCKKVLGRWLLRFTAPGPSAMGFTEVKGKANAWKIEFKGNEKEVFMGGTGAWYFQGDQKPEFVWKENTWLVTGSNFELFYHDNGAKIVRVSLKDKLLEICKNSDYAQTKENAILESFNKELVFKKDADNLNNKAEVESDSSTDWLKNLEGKGSTDHIETDAMKGKNDPLGNKINTDPMSMDLEAGDQKLGDGKMSGKGGKADDVGGNYAGESSTDKLSRKGHEGKAGDKPVEGAQLGLVNKNNEHQTHYKGHNEAEVHEAKDDLLKSGVEKHREGAQLGLANKNNEHQTHYKGHNEAEKFDPAAAHQNQYQEEKKGPITGKTSTDHLPKFYNKDGSKPERKLTPEEQKESDAYEGKSKTDKIPTHYGGGTEKAVAAEKADAAAKSRGAQANKDNKNSAEPESEDQSAYGGKSSTEKLKSHYGGKLDGQPQSDKDSSPLAEKEIQAKQDKKRSEKDGSASEESSSKESSDKVAREKQKGGTYQKTEGKDLGGTGSTDKIDTHYGRGKKAEMLTEDDLFEDSPAATADPSKKDKATGPEDDILSRKEREKKERKEASGAESGDDLYAKKDQKNKNKDSSESTFEDEDEYTIGAKKQHNHGDITGHDNVLPLKKAKDPKIKQPLVAEKEIDKDLKAMMEEADVIAVLQQQDLKVLCVLDDFFEKTLIFIASEQGFKNNEPIKLDLRFKYLQKVTSLKFDGLVVSLENLENQVSYLTVEIPDANAQSFSSFMKLYQQRQEYIDAFIKRAKGV